MYRYCQIPNYKILKTKQRKSRARARSLARTLNVSDMILYLKFKLEN